MQRQDDEIDFKLLKGFNLLKPQFYGGMSKVYRVTFRGEQCAVKSFAVFDYKTYQNERRIFALLSKLDSPYIVHYHGALLEPIFAVVLEWMPVSLSDYVHSYAGISDLRQVEMMLDVAYGVSAMHQLSILHRDIKTENILLTPGYHAKLCDFNLSISIVDLKKEDHVLGTLRMMAPEIFHEQKYSKASDVYSFGLTLWEVKKRQLPFDWIETERDMIDIKLLAQKEVVDGRWSPGVRKIALDCQDACPEKRPVIDDIAEILSKEADLLRKKSGYRH